MIIPFCWTYPHSPCQYWFLEVLLDNSVLITVPQKFLTIIDILPMNSIDWITDTEFLYPLWMLTCSSLKCHACYISWCNQANLYPLLRIIWSSAPASCSIPKVILVDDCPGCRVRTIPFRWRSYWKSWCYSCNCDLCRLSFGDVHNKEIIFKEFTSVILAIKTKFLSFLTIVEPIFNCSISGIVF